MDAQAGSLWHKIAGASNSSEQSSWSAVRGEPWRQVNYLYFNNEPLEESAWCSIPFTEDNIGSVYLMLSYTTIYFIIPMITVTILYIRYSEVLANKQSWSKSVHV